MTLDLKDKGCLLWHRNSVGTLIEKGVTGICFAVFFQNMTFYLDCDTYRSKIVIVQSIRSIRVDSQIYIDASLMLIPTALIIAAYNFQELWSKFKPNDKNTCLDEKASIIIAFASFMLALVMIFLIFLYLSNPSEEKLVVAFGLTIAFLFTKIIEFGQMFESLFFEHLYVEQNHDQNPVRKSPYTRTFYKRRTRESNQNEPINITCDIDEHSVSKKLNKISEEKKNNAFDFKKEGNSNLLQDMKDQFRGVKEQLNCFRHQARMPEKENPVSGLDFDLSEPLIFKNIKY
ncbi:UNKNOWN [Stylonychia lemnae]|uniref:Uncharacterized protein n=1 Tax=Stylonychia lemnae TaxID=5949 RepID=A0A077ZSM2_STYLE|nr:UNKNOWN [Stylonychia lemnae]|eukprot:CDW72305.1 UNKNOWN [Stylonychia lemnae]